MIAYITFLRGGIANEHAFHSTRVKFITTKAMVRRITNTSEYTRGKISSEREGGKGMLKTVNRCGEIKHSRRKAVKEMDGGGDGFPPKILGHMHMEEKAPSHFKDVTEFTFGNAILLGCIWARGFMDNAFSVKEGA